MCLHPGRPRQVAGRNENENPARATASFMDTPIEMYTCMDAGSRAASGTSGRGDRAAPACCGQAQAGRDKFQHLRENCIMMDHGSNLLVVTGFCHTSIVTTR